MSEERTQNFLSDKKKMFDILQFLQMNIAEFAKDLDVNADELYNLKSNRKVNFSQELRAKIIKKYKQINPVWLLTGEGEMLISDSTPAQPASSTTPDAEELAMLRKNNAAHLKHIELLEEKVSSLEEQLRQEREKVSSSSARMSEERILQ